MTYPDGLSGQDTPPQTQEAFRETYRQMKQAGSAAQITLFGRYRDTEQVLYCAPGYDGPFPSRRAAPMASSANCGVMFCPHLLLRQPGRAL